VVAIHGKAVSSLLSDCCGVTERADGPISVLRSACWGRKLQKAEVGTLRDNFEDCRSTRVSLRHESKVFRVPRKQSEQTRTALHERMELKAHAIKYPRGVPECGTRCGVTKVVRLH
jgi:hypothetical protein